MFNDIQRAAIQEIDRPTEDGERLRNRMEQDCTARREPDGRVRVFKVVRAAGSDVAYLYDPAAGTLDEIASGDGRLYASGEAEPPTIPIPDGGWRFPVVPDVLPAEPNMRVLMINPTEQCNIRCTYCYYGGAYDNTRLHRTREPEWDHIAEMIDRFAAQSEAAGDAMRAIYFFGGEPLLAKETIRRSIAYFKERDEGRSRNTLIQINTNGMLLNSTFVDFCVAQDVFLNVSIDGPRHDAYRIDARGRGTHDAVRRKIDWLATEYPTYFRSRVALICVLSEPVDIVENFRYFSSWQAALDALTWDFDLVLPGGNSYESIEPLLRQCSLAWEEFRRISRQPRAEAETSAKYHFLFRHGFLHRALSQAVNTLPRSGNDGTLRTLLGIQHLPGYDCAVLASDGSIYSSYEWQSDDFLVGDAANGISPERSLAQLRDFRDGVTHSGCTTCWAAPLCTVKAVEAPLREHHSVAELHTKVEAKRTRCVIERHNLAEALLTAAELRRHNPEALAQYQRDWESQSKRTSNYANLYPKVRESDHARR